MPFVVMGSLRLSSTAVSDISSQTANFEQVSDNVLMIEGGRVVRSGSVATLLGGQMPLQVDVVSGAKRLADHLAARGFGAVAKDDLRLAVPGPSDGVEDAIVAAVIELDLELRRMERGQATLGELFELEELTPPS